ncbi:C2H2 zinc finger family protein [Babesia bovis T2Bo]|uniref:C2H2 zinc finger domain containing protein n=1 Tax=Babesia bovis TaxID=5865 RepID=A7AM89_BABBO|nr:C2H2 zinc finger family protein [Babesia bovis T2Bo]EDO07673.1 C2H2 zinc finger family protein [Babesia bovis T2Bo]|eukprot:XP_001611241.1 C2H2 zinc finger domain containing protein [Babesia bovis T2Bo]
MNMPFTEKYKVTVTMKHFLISNKMHVQSNIYLQKMRKVATTKSCKDCEQHFINAIDLVKHMKEFHFDSRPYVCAICQVRFKRKDHLKRHEERHNDVKIRYKCNVDGCNKSFATERTLDVHRFIHQCNVNSNVMYILGHLVNIKEGGSIITCSHEGCGKSYASYSGMCKHIKRDHIQPMRAKIPQHNTDVNNQSDIEAKYDNNIELEIKRALEVELEPTLELAVDLDTNTQPNQICEPMRNLETERKSNAVLYTPEIKQTNTESTELTMDEEDITGYMCPYEKCGRVFSTRSNVVAHIKRQHNGMPIHPSQQHTHNANCGCPMH